MRVSIIIPAFNEERLLGSTLEAVRQAATAFATRRWDYEIIVCDNNSSDGTAEIARGAGAIVVFEPLNQIGRARNTGARDANGDWLIFIDADSMPNRELLADVAEAMASESCIAGGSTIRLATERRLALAVTAFWNCISKTLRYVAGSFVFVEAKAFRELGGFNESLYASEEIELSRRLKRYARRAGKTVVILDRHPLTTSARKVHLYTVREHLAFIGRAIFTGVRSLRSREHCGIWYDGRR